MFAKNAKNNKKQQNKKQKQRRYTELLPTTYVLRSSTGFPDRVRCVLEYDDSINFAQAGFITNYVFRGNSLYDPDVTSLGHQPKYYDQYSAVYLRYRVYASRITLKVINGANAALVAAIVPDTNQLTPTTVYAVTENPRAVVSRLVATAGNRTERISKKISTQQQLGLNQFEINDDSFTASTSNNPTALWYWNCVFANLTNVPLAGQAYVEIQYDCEFYDRIDSGPS
jgi:hypothetical protein